MNDTHDSSFPRVRHAARALLLHFWFIFICRNGCSLGFEFPQLFRADQADASPRHIRAQNPGNSFHLFLACQSPVFVERAFAHRKTDFPIQIEVSAKHFFLGRAEALDQVPVTACWHRVPPPCGVPPLTLIVTITFSFSKKRKTLRNGSSRCKWRGARFTRNQEHCACKAAGFTAS